MAQSYLRETNSVRSQFEAAVVKIGEGAAKKAFARALNHETRKASTQVKRQIAKESSIKYGDVSKATRYKSASAQKLESSIIAKGAALPLKYFGAKQFKFGVRAKVWNRVQRFDSAFVVNAYAGNVYVRDTKARFPIRKLWGPAVPNEMMRAPIIDTFSRSTESIANRAAHEVQAIIAGHVKG